MPITQRNTLAPNTLVYTTGNYINPLWIISLTPAKVGSGIPQWNASQLQGRSVSPNYPLIGDVLQWNGSSWFPTGVTGGGIYASTGVMSFNSRTGVVVLTSGDVTGALTYTPYNNTNPSGYITSSNVIFSTGSYSNPSWLTSINSNIISGAITVPSGSAQWNANKLQGYPIYTGIPNSGNVLSWTSSGWFPSGITTNPVTTGVTSFNSRTGVVTLTSADVTGALSYTPYNNTNPSGYISSGYYTASDGVVLDNSNFSLSGVGKLHELNFDTAVKIGTNYAGNGDDTNSSQTAIFIGVNAGAATTTDGSVYIGHGAGSHNTGGYNVALGYLAGNSANGSHCIEIDTTSFSRVNSDWDIHIQGTIGGSTLTRRLSFGDMVMAPDANVHVISTESTTIPFIAKGRVLQTANLIEARASDDSTLFYVDSGGYISTPSSGVATWNASQLKGYAVSGNVPVTGQVLTWNGTSWYAADVTAATALTLNSLSFNPLNSDPTAVEGRIWYDNDNHTLAYFNDSLSNNPIHIGQENVIRVYNSTGGTILKGQIVYINGAHSKTPTIDLAIANINYAKTAVGVAAYNISNGSYGYVITQGIVNDLNTNSFGDGDPIYLSPTISGAYTNIVPITPNYTVKIGNILNSHPTQGAIFICPVLESVDGNNIVGDIYVSPSGKIFTGNVMLNGAISGVLSNTTITPIDSTPYASGDCIKYIIKAKYGSAVQATEVLVVSDGTDSYMTEYGLLYSSGKLLDVSADLNSSNIRLLGQATYSNTSVHMMKVLIA